MEYTRKIAWNGNVDGLDNPVSTVWGGYLPCWWPGETESDFAYENCGEASSLYWEDYNIKPVIFREYSKVFGREPLTVQDAQVWVLFGRNDIAGYVGSIIGPMHAGTYFPPFGPKLTSYTWGEVSLTLKLFNTLRGVLGGKAGRRSKLDTWSEENPEDKKKLIRLICRVKGEKVYDEKKEVGDVKIKLKDVDMVINEILGKIKVETKDVL